MIRSLVRHLGALVPALLLAGLPHAAEVPGKAPNFGSITNTRHNLTQSFLPNGGAGWMILSRNDYGEVCVYCHTPHAANTAQPLPLWNRTMVQRTYTTYNLLGTSSLTQTVMQPGAASLSCLSCHDGQTAVDSIINMPGSGRARLQQAVSVSQSFLDSWPVGPSQFPGFGGHGTLDNSPATFNNYGECQSCHSINGPQHDPSTTPVFDVFNIGTDLRNDHPVGVTFPPEAQGSDFAQPNRQRQGMRWFDSVPNDRPDKNEVRLYASGDTFTVECASCHDPHGVPSGGPAGQFAPTFLRISNAGSALCLVCHIK